MVASNLCHEKPLPILVPCICQVYKLAWISDSLNKWRESMYSDGVYGASLLLNFVFKSQGLVWPMGSMASLQILLQ